MQPEWNVGEHAWHGFEDDSLCGFCAAERAVWGDELHAEPIGGRDA